MSNLLVGCTKCTLATQRHRWGISAIACNCKTAEGHIPKVGQWHFVPSRHMPYSSVLLLTILAVTFAASQEHAQVPVHGMSSILQHHSGNREDQQLMQGSQFNAPGQIPILTLPQQHAKREHIANRIIAMFGLDPVAVGSVPTIVYMSAIMGAIVLLVCGAVSALYIFQNKAESRRRRICLTRMRGEMCPP